MADIDWVLIKKFKAEPIGALGFIGDDVAVIAAFYDDRDGNKDGRVSMIERIGSALSPVSLQGSAVVEVAMQARVDPDIILRDASFAQQATKMWLSYARGLISDAVYAVYFTRGVKMTGRGISKIVTKNMVHQIVIRKGFEKAARKAFDNSVKI